jgi:hypothetical protein
VPARSQRNRVKHPARTFRFSSLVRVEQDCFRFVGNPEVGSQWRLRAIPGLVLVSLRSVSEAIRRSALRGSGQCCCAGALLIQRLEGSRYDRSTLCLFNRGRALRACQKWAAGSWRSIAMVTDAAYSVMREGSEWSGDALLPIVAMHVEGTSFGSGGLMRRMGLGPVENEGKVARQ